MNAKGLNAKGMLREHYMYIKGMLIEHSKNAIGIAKGMLKVPLTHKYILQN